MSPTHGRKPFLKRQNEQALTKVRRKKTPRTPLMGVYISTAIKGKGTNMPQKWKNAVQQAYYEMSIK